MDGDARDSFLADLRLAATTKGRLRPKDVCESVCMPQTRAYAVAAPHALKNSASGLGVRAIDSSYTNPQLMKRIRDRAQFRRNQQRAARRGQYTRSHNRTGFLRPQPASSRRITKQSKVAAPSVFSLIENPDETLKFFARLDAVGTSKRAMPLIHLEDVTRMTIDAVLLLISKIKALETIGIGIAGNAPKDEAVKNVLIQSDFFSQISNKPADYRSDGKSGILTKRVGKRVREDICQELVHFATSRVFGSVRKNGGLYRALVECMANTRDHATIGQRRLEPWWVTAYFDKSTGIAHFAFLDNGVGIFESARMRTALQMIGKFLNILNPSDVLMDILDNNLGSRTGLPYRGKGLPAIKRALVRNQISNLRIITNQAFLDVSLRKGGVLPRPFNGTCLTWEIRP
jgi:hypothetical protein